MKTGTISIHGLELPVHSINTLVIGSGTAALKAAVSLHDFGQTDILIATTKWGAGTSNNAGSDKQTYYKLSAAGDKADSPFDMAQDLCSGGCMHGDIALCEAQHSLQAFYHLVQLGVPFPHDQYGGFVGYKTDHDPRGRGTSAGPLTSHLMFEALSAEVERKGIRVLDNHPVIALLASGKGESKYVCGAIAIDTSRVHDPNFGLVLINAVNVVLGTGGPAGMYKTSVYPHSQSGSTGMALRIGAKARNLTESQFGLSSTKVRWNLSGSYQQVIPRYVSTDADGNDEREFLNDVFPDFETMSSAIFLKGYQWPFDPKKVENFGSSLIDLLVYREREIKHRRVFLDFTRNPDQKNFALDKLNDEAYAYLNNSDALADTPIKRLKKLNLPAIELYRNKGIDLTKERLEIAVCAQHNNGGLSTDIWWESNIRHLFPVGEVAGTHGVYRPGGSALNAGQVGGLRAAMYISKRYSSNPQGLKDFEQNCGRLIEEQVEQIRQMLSGSSQDSINCQSAQAEFQERMTSCGSILRDPERLFNEVPEAGWQYQNLLKNLRVTSASELPEAFVTLDSCFTHLVYLHAILYYMREGGQSRGSFLLLEKNGTEDLKILDSAWRYSLVGDDTPYGEDILELYCRDEKGILFDWIDPRPIPEENNWFETTWKEYREDRIVRKEK